jgi:hypothetical protein
MPNFPASFRFLPVAAAFVLALPACAAEPRLTGVAPPTRIPDAPEPPLNQPIERVATAAVPVKIRRLVVADAAKHAGVAQSAIVLIRADRVVWSDAGLGCPKEGMGYVQMTEPGYRVVARAPGTQLVYHTNERTDEAASVVRCVARVP